MTFIGASLQTVLAVTSLGVAGLLALQWLKTRYPDRVVSSAMLWSASSRRSSPRSLWSRFARPLSLVLPLLALLAGALAVLEPVWEPDDSAGMTVVVYETGRERQAVELFERLSPLHRRLVWAEGGGMITGTAHRELAGMCEQTGRGQTDRMAVAALAERLAGPAGLVVWLGDTPPPQLPDRCVFMASDTPLKADGESRPLTVRVTGAQDRVRQAAESLPGVQLVESETKADCLIELSEDKAEAWTELVNLIAELERTGLYEVGRDNHQQELPRDTERVVTGNGWKLETLLFALAMLAYAADLWLWSKGRTM